MDGKDIFVVIIHMQTNLSLKGQYSAMIIWSFNTIIKLKCKEEFQPKIYDLLPTLQVILSHWMIFRKCDIMLDAILFLFVGVDLNTK